MKDSTKIDLLGDTFELFSLTCEEEIFEKPELVGAGIQVFILPSFTADFAIRVYDKNKKECQEYYAAALIAAAFLTRKRGLPLSEISFEAPCGNIDVFCTGNGVFKIKIDKCKHLLSSVAVCTGCDEKYNDFLVTKKIRAIHTEDISCFSKSRLAEFAMLGSPFPAAVISTFSEAGKLKMNSFRDYTALFISNILLWCCAALNEMITAGKSVCRFHLPDYGAEVEVTSSSVTVEITPIIL